jgi:hypothetical protein
VVLCFHVEAVGAVEAEEVGVGPSAGVSVGCSDHERDVRSGRDGGVAGLDGCGGGSNGDLGWWVVAEEFFDGVVE